jgi:hypothetical protein
MSDHVNAVYTGATDVRMNVADCTATGAIATTWSRRFHDPRIVVLADDEFTDHLEGSLRRALLGFTRARPANGPTAQSVAHADANPPTTVRIRA